MIKLQGVNKGSTINTTNSPSPGAYYLADNPELYEIQRSNNFEFSVVMGRDRSRESVPGNGPMSFLKVGNTADAASETNSSFTSAAIEDVLRVSVSASSVPHFTQEVIPVRRGNSVQKFAGVATFAEGSIELNDYIGAETKDILMTWQNLSYNVMTEKVGLVTDYKKDAYLTEYTPDYQVVRVWKLKGCWISGISESNYSHDDTGGPRKITATIQYDTAYIVRDNQ